VTTAAIRHADSPRTTGAAIKFDRVYKCLVAYAEQAKIAYEGFGLHSLRATGATNSLEHEAAIAKVQGWLATQISRPLVGTIAVGTDRKTRPRSRPVY